jgi:hypothetical protein
LEIKQNNLPAFYTAIAVPAETGSFCCLLGKKSDENGHFTHLQLTKMGIFPIFWKRFLSLYTQKLSLLPDRGPLPDRVTPIAGITPRHSPAISQKKAPHE